VVERPQCGGIWKGSDHLVSAGKRQAVTNAENTVYSIKRFIGRRWNDTEAERHQVPYYCVRARRHVDVQIRGRTYTPQEISAMPAKLKQDAEASSEKP